MTTDSLPAWLVDLPTLDLVHHRRPRDPGDGRARAGHRRSSSSSRTSYLNFGRRFYAIGSNPDAAELIGLPTRRIVFTAFVLSGALSGLAGFMFLARFGNITVEAGRGLELQSVAAVVVGGVNIFGGSGTVVGAMLGAVMIGTLEQSLFRLQISEFWRDARPRPPDPARRRQRRRHPQAPAAAVGARRPEADRQAGGAPARARASAAP